MKEFKGLFGWGRKRHKYCNFFLLFFTNMLHRMMAISVEAPIVLLVDTTDNNNNDNKNTHGIYEEILKIFLDFFKVFQIDSFLINSIYENRARGNS